MEFFQSLTGWHWFGATGLMLIIELMIPAFFFLWLSAAALTTGIVVLIVPSMDWKAQLILFSILSIVSILAWLRFKKNHVVESDRPDLNRRGHQYIGRTFTLTEAIQNGVGKVKVGDTQWRVRGPDLPNGTNVKVVDVDGADFQVEAS